VAKNATLVKLPQFQFKTEMQQIRFRPQTPLWELKVLPRPLDGFKESYLGREEKGGERRRGEEKDVDGPFKFVNTPLARDCSLH